MGIRAWTAGKPLIVVMPDGGAAGWYSNPVSSNVGPRNWETFHISQLLPWVDANFRTYAEYNGRAVSGFSMGGFGALKYAAKYYGHFASVSCPLGPGQPAPRRGTRHPLGQPLVGGRGVGRRHGLRRAAVERGPGQRRQPRSACGELPEQAGVPGRRDQPDPVNWFDTVNETQVLAGQREFRGVLGAAGIPHEWHEAPGGHFVRPADLFPPGPGRDRRPPPQGLIRARPLRRPREPPCPNSTRRDPPGTTGGPPARTVRTHRAAVCCCAPPRPGASPRRLWRPVLPGRSPGPPRSASPARRCGT
ncbi:hypothetical protein SCALM49S_10336 [Streptomyces californicus]